MVSAGSPARAQLVLADVNGSPVTLSGWMRTREYVWSFFQSGPVGGKSYENSYNYQANTLRLGVGYQTEGVNFFAEVEAPAFIDLPSNAIAPAPQGLLGLGANYYQPHQNSSQVTLFLKQGFVEFGDRLLKGFDIKGGRFEFNEGQDLMPSDPQLKWIVDNQNFAALDWQFRVFRCDALVRRCIGSLRHAELESHGNVWGSNQRSLRYLRHGRDQED